MLRRTLIGLVTALLLAAPASAGTIVVTLGLQPGKLAVKAAPATVSTAPAQVAVTVADGRGTGEGWTLKVASSAPVTVRAVTARCAAHSTCTLPKAERGPSGSVVLQAARDSGMGVMRLVVTLTASHPTAVSFTVS